MEINSNKILQHSLKPQKLGRNEQAEHILTTDLKWLKANISIYYDLFQADELLIQNINYFTHIDGTMLGVIDLFFCMLEGRAIESIDRINTKEFDHYCRENKNINAFKYYDTALYEILALGEKIFKHITPKQEKHSQLLTRESFFELSFSEQVELIEEVLSLNFYKLPLSEGIEVNFEEVVDGTLILSSNTILENEITEILKSDIKMYIMGYLEFNLIFRKDNSQ